MLTKDMSIYLTSSGILRALGQICLIYAVVTWWGFSELKNLELISNKDTSYVVINNIEDKEVYDLRGNVLLTWAVYTG